MCLDSKCQKNNLSVPKDFGVSLMVLLCSDCWKGGFTVLCIHTKILILP